jgi:hypothetical protein
MLRPSQTAARSDDGAEKPAATEHAHRSGEIANPHVRAALESARTDDRRHGGALSSDFNSFNSFDSWTRSPS